MRDLPKGQGAGRAMRFNIANTLELTKHFLARRPELKGLIDLGRIERKDYGLVFITERNGERYWFRDERTGEWFVGQKPPVSEKVLGETPRAKDIPAGTAVRDNPFLFRFMDPDDTDTRPVALLERKLRAEDLQTINGVFWNRFGITDPKIYNAYVDLGAFEADVYLLRHGQDLDPRKFATFQELHKAQFDMLLPWAGELRHCEVSFGSHWGTPSDLLPQAAKSLERDILGRLELPSEPRALAQELARTHNELIRIHPFLDGNGRTTRLFNDLQAVQAGKRRPWMQYDVRIGGADRDAYLHASNAYFQGEKEELEKMIEKTLV